MKIIEIISYNSTFYKINVMFDAFSSLYNHYIIYRQIRKIKYVYYIYLA